MSGTIGRRHCETCATNVHDLSALTADDAARLLRSQPAGRLCVRVKHDEEGTILFKTSSKKARLAMKLALGASLLAAACDPASDKSIHENHALNATGDIDSPTLALDASARAPAKERPGTPPASEADRQGKEFDPARRDRPHKIGPVQHPAPNQGQDQIDKGDQGKGKSVTLGCVCVAHDPLCACL